MKATNLVSLANIFVSINFIPKIANTQTVAIHQSEASKNTAMHSHTIHSYSTSTSSYHNAVDTASLAYQIMGLGEF